MIDLKIGALAAVCALGAGSAQAQELWQGARAGMTVAEVVAAVPNATAAEGEPVQDRTLGAEVKGLTIGDDPWEGRFYFGEDGLGLVVLVPTASVSRTAMPSMFNPIVDDLREAYGDPFSCEDRQFGRSCEWRSDDRLIQAGLLTAYGLNSISISYEKRSPVRPPL